MTKIIALTGAAGSGKDTVADYLASYHFNKVGFATPLKMALAAITCDEKFLFGDREDKEATSPALGMSRRAAMQIFGQEVRNIFGQNVWVNSLKLALADVDKAVVTDCRYDNEAQMLKELGATVIRIVRPNNEHALTGPEAQHASEVPINDAYVDVEIVNDGSLSDLYQEIDRVMQVYFKEGAQ